MSTPPTIAHAIITVRVCFEIVLPGEDRSAGEVLDAAGEVLDAAGEVGAVEVSDENGDDKEEAP